VQILYRIVFQLEDIIQFAEIFQLFNDSKRDKGRKALPIRRALYGRQSRPEASTKSLTSHRVTPSAPAAPFLNS
jgi:hypothetical protein